MSCTLTVAYAITFHKSQGITVSRAVLNLTLRNLPQGFDMWQYHGSSLWRVGYLRSHLIMSVWLQAAH
jgi:hypothetical protein